MKLAMTVSEGERTGVTVVHGRSVIDAGIVGKILEVTIVEGSGIFVQKSKAV